MPATIHDALPAQFYSQHATSKSTVFVVLHRAGHYPALQSVLTCTDPALCEEMCRQLNTLIDPDPADPATVIAAFKSRIPAPVFASLRQAAEWTAEGWWPVASHVHHPRPTDATDDEPQLEDPLYLIPRAEWPDFTALFPATTARHTATDIEAAEDDDEDEDDGKEFQLTAKSAATLWLALAQLVIDAEEDLDEHGGAAVADNDEWLFFNRLPTLSWGQDAQWRRLVIQAGIDLQHDIAAGREPEPRNNAEELLLHLAIEDADEITEEYDLDTVYPTDTYTDDRDDWAMIAEYITQDSDVLMLYDPDLAGIEHPDSLHNKAHGIGDLRPGNWMTWFRNVESRDPARIHASH